MKTLFGTIENGIVYTDRGGRIICLLCNSTKGVYARNYRCKDKNGKGYLKLFRHCANCGCLEVTNNYTGEILKQEGMKVQNENHYKKANELIRKIN